MSLPLEPRPPGDPAAMVSFADGLSRRAEELARNAEVLGSRSRMTTFEGPAARRLSGFLEKQVRSLRETAADLQELANRCRREAAAVQDRIHAWEVYRDRMLQQRLEQAADPGNPP